MATGIYLTSIAGFWTLGWVQVAVAAWIVNVVAAMTMVKPVMARIAQRIAQSSGESVDPDLNDLRWSARWSFGGDLLMANEAAMLYLMTIKPGIVGSLVAVGGINVVNWAARLLGRAHRPVKQPDASAAQPLRS